MDGASALASVNSPSDVLESARKLFALTKSVTAPRTGCFLLNLQVMLCQGSDDEKTADYLVVDGLRLPWFWCDALDEFLEVHWELHRCILRVLPRLQSLRAPRGVVIGGQVESSACKVLLTIANLVYMAAFPKALDWRSSELWRATAWRALQGLGVVADTTWEELRANLEYELEKLSAEECIEFSNTAQPNVAIDEQAVERLFGWPEILDAIKRPDSDVERVRRLNRETSGPIQTRQGGDPRVNKKELIAWWNRLEQAYDETCRKAEDTAATVANQHQFGKEGTVVSDINGGVRQRRKPKSS